MCDLEDKAVMMLDKTLNPEALQKARTHELKTWPDIFQAIVEGKKRHEIRVNDRNFRAGDTLLLREYEPTTRVYSGREITVRVTFISHGGAWGLPEELCVMSIAALPRTDLVERMATVLCKSRKFETGEGTCAVICMDQLGDVRAKGCGHCSRVHGKLAQSLAAVISATGGVPTHSPSSPASLSFS